ncbi:hypothetical protein KGP93_42800, partial [Burkholderia multivorans]|nr:hypothetical protein [Burkholderia multivorans]
MRRSCSAPTTTAPTDAPIPHAARPPTAFDRNGAPAMRRIDRRHIMLAWIGAIAIVALFGLII